MSRRLAIAGRCWLLLAAAASVAPAGAPAAPPAPSAPPAAPAAPSAQQLVHDYNARDIGAPGWRRVFLALLNDGQVTRRFSILHLFARQGGELRSLVVLEVPAGLRGTDYLLIEDARQPTGMKLFLHLPAGQERVLAVVPSRFEEGLLGSDFGYSDLRWLIPTAGYRFAVVGAATLLGRRAWEVEAEPVSPEVRDATVWALVRYYLGTDPPVLLGADFHRRREAPPAKRLRIATLEQRGGIWTPTRMVMDAAAGRGSVLTLGETGFGKGPADPDLFAPEALARNAVRLLAEGFGKPATGPRP